MSRSGLAFRGKRVLVIGNSASGPDTTAELVRCGVQPRVVPAVAVAAGRGQGADRGRVEAAVHRGRLGFRGQGRLRDYGLGKLQRSSITQTFSRDHPRTLGLAGVPRALTFCGFEYQAVALARARRDGARFHDVPWAGGDTPEWLDGFFRIAGLVTLRGGRKAAAGAGAELEWALQHVRKHPGAKSGWRGGRVRGGAAGRSRGRRSNGGAREQE